jgi:Cytochrome c.
LAADTGHYGIGTTATAKEIAGWDIDVRPDGKGLPKGEGSVAQGEPMYEAKCASCHGSFGEGEDRWPPLAGGEGSLTEDRPEKTVGSYWPYASTLWDYINRAMPFTAPQSLTPHEVYAISAYVLYLNDLVEDDFVLTQSNLASVKMPNVDNFYIDNRPDTNNKRCMKDCKDPSKIVIIKSLSGITPDQK